MDIEINGLDKLEKKIDQMKDSADELIRTPSVSFDELFNQSFMQKHTQFNTIDELFNAGNYVMESAEDYQNILNDKNFDSHIKQFTEFNNWDDMIQQAAGEYAVYKLDL